MDKACTEGGALAESVVFLRHFSDLPDPRQRGKAMYWLDEILLLCLLAVLAGAETIVDIARFGEKKRELLRRFRPFGDGTPSPPTDGLVRQALGREQRLLPGTDLLARRRRKVRGADERLQLRQERFPALLRPQV